MYLAQYPVPDSASVLQAMGVERPVVAMKCGEEAEQSQAATLVGGEGAIMTKDPAAYIERVSRIIRDAGYRQKLGQMMRSRVEQHFSFAQTARHLEQLFDQLMQRRLEADAGRIICGGVPIEQMEQMQRRSTTQGGDQPVAELHLGGRGEVRHLDQHVGEVGQA